MTVIITNTVLQDVQIKNNLGPFLMFVSQSSSFRIKGRCSFCNNSGAIVLYDSDVSFIRAHVVFVNNTEHTSSGAPGTIIFAIGKSMSSSITVFTSRLIFKHNYGQHSGGITLRKASILLQQGIIITFIDNYGEKGGALSFFQDSSMVIGNVNDESTVTLFFADNQAQKGGAIYIEDRDYLTAFIHNFTGSVICLFYFTPAKMFNGSFKLIFSNNTATIGGNHIYGGWIDWTLDKQGSVIYNPNVSKTVEFRGDDDIASDPTRVCICINNIVNCSVTEYPISVFPRQTLKLEAVAVGQRFGNVLSIVDATFKPNSFAG